MKKSKQILTVLFLAVLVISTLCVPAFALDESEVEAAVAASGKEAVTGNVLIWFLCAVAFLKVSQKIDSFMATMGVNVGNVIKLAAKEEAAEGHRIPKEIQKELIRKRRQQKQTEAAPSEKGYRKGQRAEA